MRVQTEEHTSSFPHMCTSKRATFYVWRCCLRVALHYTIGSLEKHSATLGLSYREPCSLMLWPFLINSTQRSNCCYRFLSLFTCTKLIIWLVRGVKPILSASLASVQCSKHFTCYCIRLGRLKCECVWVSDWGKSGQIGVLRERLRAHERLIGQKSFRESDQEAET